MARRRGYALAISLEIFGPLVVYLLLHGALKLPDLWSLSAGAGVAAGTTLIGVVRRGRPNGVAILVLIELMISMVVTVVTSNPRVLLFKPAALIGAGGLYLVASCAFGRPVAYQTTLPVLRQVGFDAADGDWAWAHMAEFRRPLRVMTAAWGLVFLIDAAVRVYFAITSSITEALIAPHLIDVALIALAVLVAMRQFRSIKQAVARRVPLHAAGGGWDAPHRSGLGNPHTDLTCRHHGRE